MSGQNKIGFIGLMLILALALPWSALAQEDEDGQLYVVQLNDSLWKLAEKYLGDGNGYPSIVEATTAKASSDASFQAVTNPDLIFPGQQIWIPGSATVVAVSGGSARPESATVASNTAPAPVASTGSPSGQIAFSFWNPAPDRCTYEVNIISVPACLAGDSQCQANRRIMDFNNISEPALSPDGERVAFRGWGGPPGDDNPYAGCAEANPARFLANSTLDGTEFRGTGGFWEDSHPDWSPDGNRIIFDSGRNSDGITRIYTINPDGDGEYDLRLAGQQPSWAPDNTRFVMRGCDPTGNRCGLWIADASGALLSPVLEMDQAAHPDWSPVGSQIVYQTPQNGSWDLYVIKADGSGNRRLTSDSGTEGLPSWSPDGQWVAYLSHQGANWTINIVSADGGTTHQLFAFDGGIFNPQPVEPYGPRDWIDEQVSWSQ